LKPPGDMVRSEPWIIARMAKATLTAMGKPQATSIDWDGLVGDYDLIRDLIEAVFPAFANYNQGIRKPGGFHLTNSASLRQWNTPDGKAQFLTHASLDEDEVTDDPTVLKLTTLRSHDQYNTTVYALDDRYRGVFGRRDILFVSPKELARLGFSEGDLVDVSTALAHAAPGRVVRG
jgi:anaerobic selenocysteine-containing dehydrogenase